MARRLRTGVLRPVDLEQAKQAVQRAVERLAPTLKATSRAIYAEPELGHQEYKASARLTGLLEDAGFDVRRGAAGMPTAFVAAWPTGAEAGPASGQARSAAQGGSAVQTGPADGPTVALLAEYDALPGVGHGCGHNLIGTAAAGAGMALASLGAGAFPGRVLVVGCPAEEGGVDGAGGKVLHVQAGTFAGVDAALMVHPGSLDTGSAGSACRLALEVDFRGKAAHAAGAPHEGINALEAVIQTFNAVNALRQHLPATVRVHGIVAKGGEAPNVVPDEGLIRLYVRAPTLEELRPAAEKVKNCARGAALATGCRVAFREFAHTYLDLRANGPLDEAFAKNMAALGRPLSPRERAESGRGMGSTDTGNVSHVVPAIHPFVAVCEHPGGPPSHSREFAEATVGPAGEAALIVAAKALAMTCLDLFLSPGTLAAVRKAGPARKSAGPRAARP